MPAPGNLPGVSLSGCCGLASGVLNEKKLKTLAGGEGMGSGELRDAVCGMGEWENGIRAHIRSHPRASSSLRMFSTEAGKLLGEV